jgi:hypothetical protein
LDFLFVAVFPAHSTPPNYGVPIVTRRVTIKYRDL